MTPADVVQLVATPVTAIGGMIFGCIKSELGHLYHHGRNVQRLEESVRDLITKRSRYKGAVERAEAGMKEIQPEVSDWLEVAASELEDHRNWRSRAAGATCCIVPFVKWSESRRAVAKVTYVEKLLQRGNFATVSAGSRPPPDVEEMRSADYVAGLPSVEAAIGDVMDALRDDDVRSIGIYGLPGIGKTSLVQEVNNRLRENGMRLFSKVIVTTIGSDAMNMEMRGMIDADNRRVQDEIAERLGLKLGSAGTSMTVRANILRERMEKERRVLLVLVDVAEAFDPVVLGIPDASAKCKIIVTTWSHDVCRQMAFDKTIELRRLDKDESWKLFRWVVGDVLDLHGRIETQGREVARYCGGLPLALVSLGRSMRGEGNSEAWMNLSDSMERSHLPGHKEVVLGIESIKLSFNRLKDEHIKQCFLFCRTFPREHEILVSDLRAYGFGLGFLKAGKLDDLETARNRLFTFIMKLTSACLLDYGNNMEILKVKLPSVVRDMAISVMIKIFGPNYFFGLPGKSLTSWPHEDIESENYKIISLMHNSIQELPSTFHCPSLQCLLLQNNPELRAIPDGFFQDARSLRVLDLSNTSLSSLPKTFTCLSSNLRTLLLNDCGQLSDVSLIGDLLKLEILCLRRTNISQLPPNMKNLTKLKLLDLSDAKNLKLVPPGVLSVLMCLEELYMNNSFSHWHETYGVLKDDDLPRSLFAEVASLPRLVVLEAQLEKAYCLSEKHSGFLNVGEQSNVTNTSSRVSISLMGVRPMINVQSQTLNFSNLKRLKVSSCPALRSLFSTTVANMLMLLEELEVEECEAIEQIIQDIASEEALCLETLPRLMTLKLHQLPSLGSFYRPGIHLLLPWLKTISVVDCPSLTSLPLGIGSAIYLKSVEGSQEWFDEMKWPDPSLKTRLQPLFLEK